MDQPTRKKLEDAVALHSTGEMYKSERLYREVLEAEPNEPTALANLAVIMVDRRMYAKGLALAKEALAANPANPAAWSTAGIALFNLGATENAIGCYDEAVRRAPDYAAVHGNRASALAELNRWDEALESARAYVKLAPVAANAHAALGLTLRGLGRFDEALTSYNRAVLIDSNSIAARQGRAIVLHRLGRMVEALNDLDWILNINPRSAETFSVRGVVLQDMRRLRGASADLDQALLCNAEDPDAHWNRGLLKLLLGDYEEGWAEYEWRWKSRAQRHLVRTFNVPLWDGANAHQRILVHAEQGFGDTIQFCRFAKELADRGAQVVLQVPPELVRLCQTLGPDIRVISLEDEPPAVEAHCPLLGLPFRLGTRLETIPAKVPYLAVDAASQAAWRDRVSGSRLRIGIAWAGRSANPNDHTRSMPCAEILPLLALDADIHCLQRDLSEADRSWLARHPSVRIHSGELRDFSDTAALIEAMDLVISVCTAPAHLAGALAKPVWVLLSYSSDWRWLTERSDSPWYPTARLFRQEAPGAWNGVIARVAMEAKTFLAPPQNRAR